MNVYLAVEWLLGLPDDDDDLAERAGQARV